MTSTQKNVSTEILGEKCLFVKRMSRGLTLVEMVLALALGAMIMVPLGMAFQTTLNSYEKNAGNDDLLQQARVAMFRMTNDLKYCTRLIEAQSGGGSRLIFETTYLEDSDPEIEVITYEKLSFTTEILSRRVDSGTDMPLAGNATFGSDVRVIDLAISPLRLVPPDTLEVMGLIDPIEDAVAVRLALTLGNRDGSDKVTVSSTVALRNK